MIKLGLMVENYCPPGKQPDFEKLSTSVLNAERLGFESVWVADHLILGSKKAFPFLESLTTLTALAARTSRIKLGICILVLPLREPVLLAKVLSTMDHLSRGRITVAVGVGWYQKEFKACGVDFNSRGRLTEEKLAILRRLLIEDDISQDTANAKFDHVTLLPHAKNLKILMGGYVTKALERAGRIADGWVPTSYTPADFSEAWNTVLTSARQAGRDVSKLDNANLVLSCVDEKNAEERVRTFATSYFDEVPWGKVKHVEASISGSPASCIEKIRAYEKVGLRNIIISPCDYDPVQVERLAKEVLTSFK